jgi:hypothetical protein
VQLAQDESAAKVRMAEEMKKLQEEQSQQLLQIKKAELEKQIRAKLAQQKQAHLLQIEVMKLQLKMDQQKAAAMPASAAAAVQFQAAAAVSSSAAAPSASASAAKSQMKFLTSLAPNLPECLHVKSNFHESFAHMPDYHGLKFTVNAVHSVHNPNLVALFVKAKDEMQKNGIAVVEQIVWHGTHPDNIASIVSSNLSMSKKGKLDPGWFGAGLYFSPFADYSFMYSTVGEFRRVKAGDRGRLLRFVVLPGRVHHLKDLALGQPQHPNYDSNLTPNKFELILFNNHRILPTHVLDFSVSQGVGQKFEGSVEQKGAS